MKPMLALDALLDRAAKPGIFGTTLCSVINLPSKDGIAAVVAQQFEVAAQIGRHGLMPIIEPKIPIKSPGKAGAEAVLLEELTRHPDALPDGQWVMLKPTIPNVANLYAPLAGRGHVARVARCLVASRWPMPANAWAGPWHDRQPLAGADLGPRTR